MFVMGTAVLAPCTEITRLVACYAVNQAHQMQYKLLHLILQDRVILGKRVE